MNIYIDESGHTGPDFLNKEQPVFVLAACWMNESDYDELHKLLFEKLKANEIKYSAFKRRANQNAYLKLATFLNEKSDKYCAYIVDKKSVLIEKFIFDCIEPFYAIQGIDISVKGGIRCYANMLNLTLPHFMGDDWYYNLLNLFQKFIRLKNEESLMALHRHASTVSKEMRQELLPFIIDPHLALKDITEDGYKTQIYEPILMGLIGHIRCSFGINEFNIYFDQTIAIKGTGIVDLLKHFHNYKRIIKVSKYCTIFPDIRILSVQPCDSKETKLIQVSDLIAGFLAHSIKNLPNDRVLFELISKSITDNNRISKLCAKDVTPADLGTDDADGCINVHQNPF